MNVLTKFPLTIEERLEFGEVLRIPVSFDEFLDALETCEYRIEYDNGEIFSFMGIATDSHEYLVIKIGHLLQNLLDEDLFAVYGSNLALHIPSFGKKYYNADCIVVKGKIQKIPLRGKMEAVTNPIIIVEVLSPTTVDFDLGRKFKNYRNIPSLEQVIFISSMEKAVHNYRRNKGGWLLKSFFNNKDEVPLLDEGILKIEKIYKKLTYLFE